MSGRPSNLLSCARSGTHLRGQLCMRLQGCWCPCFRHLPEKPVLIHRRPLTMLNLWLTKDSNNQKYSSSKFSTTIHLMLSGLFSLVKLYLRTPFEGSLHCSLFGIHYNRNRKNKKEEGWNRGKSQVLILMGLVLFQLDYWAHLTRFHNILLTILVY